MSGNVKCFSFRTQSNAQLNFHGPRANRHKKSSRRAMGRDAHIPNHSSVGQKRRHGLDESSSDALVPLMRERLFKRASDNFKPAKTASLCARGSRSPLHPTHESAMGRASKGAPPKSTPRVKRICQGRQWGARLSSDRDHQLEIRWLHEFGAENRLEGDAFLFSTAMPLSVPSR